MPRGRGPHTGQLFRDWLIQNGSGSPTEFYKLMVQMGKSHGYEVGNIHTITTMVYLIHRKLELIEIASEHKDDNNRRVVKYRVRKGYTRDMSWSDIYKYSYPDDYKSNQVQVRYWEIRRAHNGASVTFDIFRREGGNLAYGIR